ncbi:MAG: Ig-like domain repeat protein, partial [Acidimicrobiales bacterium]|nr:Ig-like domain repeat protein [Acidimicrobiales bacterium]
FGAAAVLAARWSLLPSVVVLERAGVRAAFRRTRTLSGARLDALGTRDGWAVVVEGLVVLVVAAIAVRLFVDAGGVSVAAPPPPPPRVHVATVVVFALLAGVVQMVVDVRPASAAVSGATIVVDDLGDDADAAPGDGTCATATTTCTLRAAIEEANTSTDAVIGFAVAGTITVGAELAITAPMTVDGDLAGGPITVSGGGTSRVFFVQIEVPGGGSGAIRNLTIADGYEASVGGAAVYNGAASAGFVLDGVTVRDATVPAGALFGGAVVNVSNLTVRNSTFIGNDADAVTGGSDIANRFAGSATIDNATFTGSQGSTSLESTGASMTVRNSIVAAPTEACVGSITGAGNVTTDLAPTCPGSLATVDDLALPPLGANGGPTATVRLPAASSAVGAGVAGTCLPTDQRGVPRLAGRCDAGAYGFDPTTATALTTTPNPSVYGQDVQVDVIVTAVTEPDSPRGTVELRDGATPIGNADVAPDGTATLTVSAPVAGTHPLTAVYLPGAAFTTSTSPMVHHTVDVAGTTTALTSTGSPTLGGQPVTFTVDVTGAGGAVPTGSVDLLDGAASIVTLALDASGRATYTTSGLGGGHHDLTATYPGDANHAGSTSPILEHDVVDSSTTSLAGPAGPTIYGTDAAFVVTVAPTGGGPTPTGSVTLSEGATTVGAATLDGTGQATITVATLAPGDHALTAHYGGDGANGPSSSAAVTHTVTAAATITSLDVSPAGSSVYGNAVTVTATVSSTDSPLVPGGHVQFFDGPTSIGIAELDPSGTGSWTKLSPAVGTYDLHATYLPAPGF